VGSSFSLIGFLPLIINTSVHMSNTLSYFTEEGLKKLMDDLNNLKTVERVSISRQIAEAREKGDLSENAEYDAAKEAQGLLELRISKLEAVIANSRLVDTSKLDSSKVLVLSKVKIKNVSNGQTMEYTLVSENEADFKSGKISVNSPIGKGLLGKSTGQIAEISTPAGLIKFEILNINR
jgi:transcription elongation factor GreA